MTLRNPLPSSLPLVQLRTNWIAFGAGDGIFNMENEIWKDIAGFEGLYQASTEGRIRSCTIVIDTHRRGTPYKHHREGRIIEGYVEKFKRKPGYRVVIFKDTIKRRVHRYIAETFIPNPENRKHVNHIDGNKLNNRVENLEWTTPKENAVHASRIGLLKDKRSDKFKKEAADRARRRCSKPVEQRNSFGVVIANYPSAAEAARRNGFSLSHVHAICAKRYAPKDDTCLFNYI